MSDYGPPTQANPFGYSQVEIYTAFHIVPNGLEFGYLSCTVAACGSGPITILVPLEAPPHLRAARTAPQDPT